VETEYLFVYGTLRKIAAAKMNPILSENCRYFSKGAMLSLLYEVDGYPGAIESTNSNEKVYGEIYRMRGKTQELLRHLDEYEECTPQFPEPHEYIRKKIAVFLPNGNQIIAWVYIYNHDVSYLNPIDSGDYLQHLKTR
jgi:gamma-glutamylcyclotransferase (GGCT)/AIG2-like uncharacterized protein YtfP